MSPFVSLIIPLLTTVAAIAVAWGVMTERLRTLRESLTEKDREQRERVAKLEARVEGLGARLDIVQTELIRASANVAAIEKVADKTGAHRPPPLAKGPPPSR